MPRKDREERNEYNRRYYKRRVMADPNYVQNVIKKGALASRARRRSSSNSLITEFRANGCLVCGEIDPCCLEAHHINPAEKEYSIGKMHNYSDEKVRAELAKCVCLCCNCHRKVHKGVIAVPPRA